MLELFVVTAVSHFIPAVFFEPLYDFPAVHKYNVYTVSGRVK